MVFNTAAGKNVAAVKFGNLLEFSHIFVSGGPDGARLGLAENPNDLVLVPAYSEAKIHMSSPCWSGSRPA